MAVAIEILDRPLSAEDSKRIQCQRRYLGASRDCACALPATWCRQIKTPHPNGRGSKVITFYYTCAEHRPT